MAHDAVDSQRHSPAHHIGQSVSQRRLAAGDGRQEPNREQLMTKITWKRIRSLRTFSKAALTMLLMLLMLQSSVPAQTGSSSLRGIVLDPQGQAVAGANITLTHVETNATRKQTTNEK